VPAGRHSAGTAGAAPAAPQACRPAEACLLGEAPGPGSAALAALLERTRDVSDEVRAAPRAAAARACGAAAPAAHRCERQARPCLTVSEPLNAAAARP